MLTKKNNSFVATRVVPPGQIGFYFSNQYSAFISKNYSVKTLESPIPASGIIKEISSINICAVKGQECTLKELFESKARILSEKPESNTLEYEKNI